MKQSKHTSAMDRNPTRNKNKEKYRSAPKKKKGRHIKTRHFKGYKKKVPPVGQTLGFAILIKRPCPWEGGGLCCN